MYVALSPLPPHAHAYACVPSMRDSRVWSPQELMMKKSDEYVIDDNARLKVRQLSV
jgi:hypothetical protein